MTRSMRLGAGVALYLNLSLISPNAMADQRLFATDVLHPGEVDVQLHLSTTMGERGVTYLPSNAPSRVQDHSDNQLAEVRYGLGNDTHVGASMTYYSKDSSTQSYTVPPYPVYDHAATGFSAVNVWVKHQFINGSQSPLTLSSQMNLIAHPGTDVNGRAYTSVLAGIDVGWDFGQGIKSFAEAIYDVPNRGDFSRVASAQVGLWWSLGARATLQLAGGVAHYQANDKIGSRNVDRVGLGAIVDLLHNTYLIPNLDFGHMGAYSSNDGRFQNEAGHIKAGTLTLYHLY